MASIIDGLNKTFDSRVRLGIMSMLLVNDSVDFNTIKKTLDLTDGNLSTHIIALEREKYIAVKKQFVNKKPKTTYSVTKTGIKAFKSHIEALEEIIKTAESKDE
jgi:DNA-binding MarR family transcriptional regulator